MELGASGATLVSTSPTESEVKLKRWVKWSTNTVKALIVFLCYLHSSRKSYLIVTGVLICAVGFLIATSLLADQGIFAKLWYFLHSFYLNCATKINCIVKVIRSRKQLDGVKQELHELKLVDHQQQQALDSVCWSKECIMSGILACIRNSFRHFLLIYLAFSCCTVGGDGWDSWSLWRFLQIYMWWMAKKERYSSGIRKDISVLSLR